MIQMFSPDFYRCDTCGNVIWLIHSSSVPVICCGKAMRKLEPGETDGASEKHVPLVTEQDGSIHVQIGSVLHPSTDSHHIEWIALQTDAGIFFKEIPVGEAPAAVFDGIPGTPAAVYKYCNLHGLWKTMIHFA